MEVEILKLTDKNSKYFSKICEWQINWWGNDYKSEKVIEWMTRCLNDTNLPQTYIAIYDNEIVGIYDNIWK